MHKAGIVGAVVLSLFLAMAPQTHAQELSEKSVKTIMNYAWSIMPERFTPPNGKTIIIDKSKKDEILVPMDVAAEAIRVGRMSAFAQICDLAEDQVKNHRSLMRRQKLKEKWTDQQMLFINQLHLFTVMFMTGNIKLVEKADGDKDVVVPPSKEKSAQTCSDEERKMVKEKIAAYVSTGPSPTTTGSTKKKVAPAKEEQ